jgi:hypothetical protein
MEKTSREDVFPNWFKEPEKDSPFPHRFLFGSDMQYQTQKRMKERDGMGR